MSIPIRLAADIGGTFTDVVLESESGFQSTKVLTTLNQPEIGVMQGIDELLRLSNIEPGQITHRPANTTVCTALAVPECLVEIEVEARLDSGTPQ